MRMTFRVVVFGAMIVFLAVAAAAVFIPGLVWNPSQTFIALPYTEAEERGRVAYYSNGCNYCHTQYVRDEDTGMGSVSDGGDYVFDNPMILGSERTGPDLSYIGRKRSVAWEIEHLRRPRDLSPLSIMPNWYFLPEQELQDIAAYLSRLGDRTSAQHMVLPPAEYAGSVDPVPYPTATPVPGDQSQGWATWTAAGLQEGKEIYVKYCLTCHGCAGNGLGHYAGTKIVTPADFKQEPVRSMPDDQWFWHVSEGVPGTVMPVWKASLTEQQRWSVIRYVQQVFAAPMARDPDEGDPPEPYAGLTNPVPAGIETLEAGKHIFIRECWVCHGDAGRGHGIYRQGLEPPPPDFGDGSYGTMDNPTFTDADYFWRISEGVPWTAMPAWKLEYSDEDRWNVVHYIRTNFTQTEPRPESAAKQTYPEIAMAQTMPDSAAYDPGRQMFLLMCAHCHGLAGLGNGWDGQYLDVSPANFTDPDVRGLSDGDFFARVTYGLQNSAMPSWGEWMPIQNRWHVIKYIQQAIVMNVPAGGPVPPAPVDSVYGDGSVATDFMTVSTDMWTQDLGHTISADHGAQLFDSYCGPCHSNQGQGNGPDTAGHGIPGPAAFAPNMSQAYIFWRTWDGVPGTMMYGFYGFLSEADIWDLVAHVQTLPNQGQGG
ncbi:MAG: c-type cytochrome [Anaerolineae bacterium]|nr:c-type cytochrome [Anaerolineae bacterium]